MTQLQNKPPRMWGQARLHMVLRMREAMSREPMTYGQLIELTGLAQRTVAKWVSEWRELKQVHIAHWAPDKRGRLFVAMYAWGDGEDKPRPGPAMTDAQRMRVFRQQQKDKPTNAGIGIDDLI